MGSKFDFVYILDLAADPKMVTVSELLWGRALPHESLLIVIGPGRACTAQGLGLELGSSLIRARPGTPTSHKNDQIEVHTKKVTYHVNLDKLKCAPKCDIIPKS